MIKPKKKSESKKKENKILQLKAKMKWGDFIIILIALIISFGLWGKLWISPQTGKVAHVIAKEQELLQFDLNTGVKIFENKKIFNIVDEYKEEVTKDEILIMINSNSTSFTIQLKDGKIRFKESDCSQRVCVNTGFISKNGQIAACVPAGVLIKITGEKTKDEPDLIIG